VPVDEDEASESRIASSKQKASIAFTTTHWSVVLKAQGQSSAAHEALEKLCRTYWRPVYGFIRRQGTRTQEAEDLTQGFFSLLLGGAPGYALGLMKPGVSGGIPKKESK